MPESAAGTVLERFHALYGEAFTARRQVYAEALETLYRASGWSDLKEAEQAEVSLRLRERSEEEPDGVVRRAPDTTLGSWCGRKFRPETVIARPGWSGIPAIASGHIYEVKSPIILQPGPAALTDGVTEIQRVIEEWASHVQARGG